MLRVTVSPTSMRSRSSQARVAAAAWATGSTSNSSASRARHGNSVARNRDPGMGSALPGAAAQVCVAETGAQQRPGVVGRAPQPGGVGLLALFGGAVFRGRRRGTRPFARVLATGVITTGFERALHGFALGRVRGI